MLIQLTKNKQALVDRDDYDWLKRCEWWMHSKGYKSNLRSVDGTTNKMNTGLWKHNSSGYKGVTWNKKIKKWQSQIGIKGRNIVLGYFDNIKEAHKVRAEYERRMI